VLQDAQMCDDVVALATDRYFDGDAAEVDAAAQRLRALEFWPHDFDGTQRALVALKRMTSHLIARLSNAAIAATRAAYGDGSLTRYTADLVVPTEARAECAVLKAVADRFVMRRDETLRMQATQREQLAQLVHAVADRAPDALEPWLREAWSAAGDDAARLRVVVDQVASLTDTSATSWFQKWCRR